MCLSKSARVILIAALLCFSGALRLSAQQPGSTPASTPDEVVRVNTELIQSPVIVLDKQGNFVGSLGREQFELSINGHVQPISFFEEITAGTAGEVEKYEAARKGVSPTQKPEGRLTAASVYGRTVVFFIDDLHLDAESVNHTRAALLNFIDHSLGQNDRAMVIAASGQIGFLQQLTDNKDMLHAAVERLKHREFYQPDDTRPPMEAYQALAIENGDSGTLQYFADMAVRDIFARQSAQMPNLGGGKAIAEADRRGEQNRAQAETYVKNRARNILIRYSSVSAATLAALKQSMASLNQLPGSKLVFLISDGFFLNRAQPSELQKLNEITSGAMRAGAVVYSIQASGLSSTFPDAKAEVRLGPNGNTGGPMIGQDGAMQAPLYTLAVDTGGQAFFNSNSMDRGIGKALQETSKYYLLAWRPDPEEKRADVFHRIQVTVKGHPEWSVRMQKGYFQGVDSQKTAATKAAAKPQLAVAAVDPAHLKTEKMRETLSSLYPVRELPALVNVSFLDQPTAGAVLNIGTELSVAPLLDGTGAEKETASIDLIGVVLNDEGKTVSSFGGQFKFDLASSTAQGQTITHVDEIKVKPGLYQVRVAVRDEKSGLNGSAAEWILVPDLAGGKVTLSSLLIGDVNAAGAGTSADQKARISINHHFTRSGRMRFFTYVYNAARGLDGKSAPDITVQLRVMRDDQVLSTSPQIKVPTEGVADQTRIPYAAEIALRMLPPGRYALSVTATDNMSKSTFTQTVKFVVE